MRFFNTEGPVRADKHYTLPPLDRIDLDQVLTLIGLEKYFVFHAPRQTGKTTTLLALRDRLNSGAAGDLRAVYANLEDAQALREDLEPAMRTVLAQIARQERLLGDTLLTGIWRDAFAEVGAGSAFGESLTRWCLASPRPLVLLLDEVDALVGDTLLSLLRQLRAGYTQRPEAFPLSVVLCGVRDVRDYRVKWAPDRETNEGGSPFNIRAESLRLGDLDEVGIGTLLGQHTEDTGQAFTDEALAAVWEQTRGQPWLVNALAFQACFRDSAGRDRSRTVTADDILNAREALIRRRDTHLDQLGARLRQERVRRVIEPLLTGASVDDSTVADIEYSRDLGLIASDDPIRITNPIYREVIPRELTGRVQSKLAQQRTARFVTEDGGLDMPRLLSRFQEYFREHSEHWISRFDYEEGRPATAAAGVLPARHQQRRPHGTGVRPRQGPDGSPADVARSRWLAEVRRGMQSPPRQPGGNGTPGPGTDGSVYGSLRRRVRPPRDLRPPRQTHLEGEDLPQGDRSGRLSHHHLGDVVGRPACRTRGRN